MQGSRAIFSNQINQTFLLPYVAADNLTLQTAV